jgi:hypothetical protein
MEDRDEYKSRGGETAMSMFHMEGKLSNNSPTAEQKPKP